MLIHLVVEYEVQGRLPQVLPCSIQVSRTLSSLCSSTLGSGLLLCSKGLLLGKVLLSLLLPQLRCLLVFTPHLPTLDHQAHRNH